MVLKQGMPLVGGEPTRQDELRVLKMKGVTDVDNASNRLLGGLSQALGSGDISDTSPKSLATIDPRLAQALKAPLAHGGWNLDAPPLHEFTQRYRDTHGIELAGDRDFPLRINIGDVTRHGPQSRASMMTRDRHLLGLIEQQLADRHSVWVVYGGNHWAALSAALEERMGEPQIMRFPKQSMTTLAGRQSMNRPTEGFESFAPSKAAGRYFPFGVTIGQARVRSISGRGCCVAANFAR